MASRLNEVIGGVGSEKGQKRERRREGTKREGTKSQERAKRTKRTQGSNVRLI